MPSHNKVEGNEKADEYAKAAADCLAPCQDDATPRELRDEASLSYMTRTATEARSQATTAWIQGNVRAERRYRPPPGRGLRRKHLQHKRKELAGRFYQFLSGHALVGAHLHRIGTIDDDKCWWCNTGEKQTRFHLVARCLAWEVHVEAGGKCYTPQGVYPASLTPSTVSVCQDRKDMVVIHKGSLGAAEWSC